MSLSISPSQFLLILTVIVVFQSCSYLGVYHCANGSLNSFQNREHFYYRSYPPKIFFLEGKSKKVAGNSENSDSSGCKSIETEIQVSKEEKVTSTGQLVRVCEGVVRVAKCEGVCTSRLRPWINSPSGFLKVIFK